MWFVVTLFVLGIMVAFLGPWVALATYFAVIVAVWLGLAAVGYFIKDEPTKALPKK